MKKCGKCKEIKLNTCFYKHLKSKDLLQHWCKECSYKYSKEKPTNVIQLKWIWGAMIQRCTNPKNKQFNDYGGRGIDICKEWRMFKNFYADMNNRKPKQCLDRIDNNKGYSKDNCRWVDHQANNENKRIYKANKTGISGVLQRNDREGEFRVRVKFKKKIVVDKTTNDFFEACCIKKAAELFYFNKE